MQANNLWNQMSEGCREAVAQLLGFYPLDAERAIGFKLTMQDIPAQPWGFTIGDALRAYLAHLAAKHPAPFVPRLYSEFFTADHVDYATAEEAIAAVEEAGQGSVVKFYRGANLPGCLPAHVDRSQSLWTYEGGKWHAHYIHDGHGGKLCEERPH